MLFRGPVGFLAVSWASGVRFLQTRYRRKAGSKSVLFFAVWLFDFAVCRVFLPVKVTGTFLPSGHYISLIRTRFWARLISLESWFSVLFSGRGISSRFYSEFSLLWVFQFMHSGGLLGSTGPGISSSGFIVHSSFLLLLLSIVCFFSVAFFLL